MRRILLAFANPDAAARVRKVLTDAGLPVAHVCSSAAELLRQSTINPDGGVVILPPWLPDLPVPVLLSRLPETYDLLILQSAGSRADFDQLPGMTILDTPMPGTLLTEMVSSLLQTRTPSPSSWRAARGCRTAQTHRRSPAEDKLLQAAKQHLMRTQWLTEEQAHRQMQIQSMETGVPLLELARRILEKGPDSGKA